MSLRRERRLQTGRSNRFRLGSVGGSHFQKGSTSLHASSAGSFNGMMGSKRLGRSWTPTSGRLRRQESRFLERKRDRRQRRTSVLSPDPRRKKVTKQRKRQRPVSAFSPTKTLHASTQGRPTTASPLRGATAAEQEQTSKQQRRRLVRRKATLPLVDDLKKKLRKKYGGIYQLRRVFRDWDANKDGVISLKEMQDVLGLSGFAMSDEEARIVYNYFDGDGNGAMQYDEFINMVYSEEGPTLGPSSPTITHQAKLKRRLAELGCDYDAEEELRRKARAARSEDDYHNALHKIRSKFSSKSLRAAFRAIDLDSDGTLDRTELRGILERSGIEMTDEAFEKMFNKFDDGGEDGLRGKGDGKISHNEFVELIFHKAGGLMDGKLGTNSINNQTAAVAAEEDPGYGNHHFNHDRIPMVGLLRRPQSAMYTPARQSRDVAPQAEALSDHLSTSENPEWKSATHELKATLRLSKVKRRLQDKIYRSRRSIRKMFMQMDRRHRGRLSYTEAREALMKVDSTLTRPEADCMVSMLDANDDGYVTVDEFARYVGEEAAGHTFDSFARQDARSRAFVNKQPVSKDDVNVSSVAEGGDRDGEEPIGPEPSDSESTGSNSDRVAFTPVPTRNLRRAKSAAGIRSAYHNDASAIGRSFRGGLPTPLRQRQRPDVVDVGVIPGTSTRAPVFDSHPTKRNKRENINLRSPFRDIELQRARINRQGRCLRKLFPSRTATSFGLSESRPFTAGALSRSASLGTLMSTSIDFSRLNAYSHTKPVTRRSHTPLHSTQGLINHEKRGGHGFLSRKRPQTAGPESKQYGRTSRDATHVSVAEGHSRRQKREARIARRQRVEERVARALAPSRERETKVRDQRVRSLLRHRMQYYNALEGRFQQDMLRQQQANV